MVVDVDFSRLSRRTIISARRTEGTDLLITVLTVVYTV